MKNERIGRGFDKYKLRIPQTPEEQQRLNKERHDRWRAAIKEGGGVFGALALPAAKICWNTLERSDAVKPYTEDAPEGYAERVLDAISAAKASIADGDADVAAAEAWRAGVDWAMAQLKFQWEELALKEKQRKQRMQDAHPPGPTQDSKNVLAEMTRLIEAGHTISGAAKRSAEVGIGTSKGANLQIWKRHKN